MPSRQARPSVLSVGAACFSCHRRHGIQARTKERGNLTRRCGARRKETTGQLLRHECARVLQESGRAGDIEPSGIKQFGATGVGPALGY
jgi:hypothetical protein